MTSLFNLLDLILVEYQNFRLTVAGLAYIAFLFFMVRLMLWLLEKALSRHAARRRIKDQGRRQALIQITKYFGYSLAFALSLQYTGINLSLLMAGSAALLVGIGFGLQHTFNDFISGVILLFDGSVAVGNVVQVGELIGRIKKINIRTTTLETPESISVIVPNSQFTQDRVINWSHNLEATRFSVQVGVAYGSDVARVMEALYKATTTHRAVLKHPPAVARFVDFSDSALLFEILFWTEEVFSVEFIKSDLRVSIDAAFRQEDIRIPFPQRDLHIIK